MKSFLCLPVTAFLLLSCSDGRTGGILVPRLEELGVQILANEVRFLNVRDMTLLDDHLWVLDGAAPYLTRISIRTGSVLRLGEKGDGPGEFRDPWAVQPTPDSTALLVWDFSTHRVSEFDPEGGLIRSTALDPEGRILARPDFSDVSYTDVFRVRSTQRGFLAASFGRRLDHTADFSSGWLRESTANLEPGTRILAFSELLEPGLESMTEWAPMPFWDTCSDTLAVWNPAGGEVLWIDPVSRNQSAVSPNLPVKGIDRSDIERYLKRMARLELGPLYRYSDIDFHVMARRYRDRFSSLRPTVTDLRCGEGGRVWLRLFSTDSDPLGKASEWLIIGRGGPERLVKAPHGFSPILLSEEGCFGSYQTREGDQVIAVAGPVRP